MLRQVWRRGRDRNRLWAGHDQLAKARYLAARVAPYLPPQARLLDIACGDGQALAALGEWGCRGVGIEVSARRLGRCRARGLHVVRADMTATLPFAAASFDVVSLISTLEHIPSPEGFLREVARVLAPEGVVVVQIPNPHFPVDLHYMLPLYGYLPEGLRRRYRRAFAGEGYAIDYYARQLTRRQVQDAFSAWELLHASDFVYPAEVAPDWLRPWYRLYTRTGLARLFPTGHLLVLRQGAAQGIG
jgi:SAM-dependent methyltransferase